MYDEAEHFVSSGIARKLAGKRDELSVDNRRTSKGKTLRRSGENSLGQLQLGHHPYFRSFELSCEVYCAVEIIPCEAPGELG